MLYLYLLDFSYFSRISLSALRTGLDLSVRVLSLFYKSLLFTVGNYLSDIIMVSKSIYFIKLEIPVGKDFILVRKLVRIAVVRESVMALQMCLR